MPSRIRADLRLNPKKMRLCSDCGVRVSCTPDNEHPNRSHLTSDSTMEFWLADYQTGSNQKSNCSETLWLFSITMCCRVDRFDYYSRYKTKNSSHQKYHKSHVTRRLRLIKRLPSKANGTQYDRCF